MPGSTPSTGGEDPPDPLPVSVALDDASSLAGFPLADALPEPVAAGDASSLAALPPWDGSQPWPEPDPNQVGSGWDDMDELREVVHDWSHWDGDPDGTGWRGWPWNGRVEPDAAVVNGLSETTVALLDEIALGEAYDHLAADFARIRAPAQGDTPPLSGASPFDPSPFDDDAGNPMSWFQDYLEFVILQRACAATRRESGLPAVACTRRSPCATCRLHDGSYVPSSFWHTMDDQDLERHLAQYLRVRNRLPAWSSRRPSGLLPPVLDFGAPVPATAATSSTSEPITAPPVPSATPSTMAPPPAARSPASPTSGGPVSATPPSSTATVTFAGASPALSGTASGGPPAQRRFPAMEVLAQFQRDRDELAQFIERTSISLLQGQTDSQSVWGRQFNGALRSAWSRGNGTSTDGNFVHRSAVTGWPYADDVDEESEHSNDDDVPSLIASDGGTVPRRFPPDWMSHPADCACQRYMRARREE